MFQSLCKHRFQPTQFGNCQQAHLTSTRPSGAQTRLASSNRSLHLCSGTAKPNEAMRTRSKELSVNGNSLRKLHSTKEQRDAICSGNSEVIGEHGTRSQPVNVDSDREGCCAAPMIQEAAWPQPMSSIRLGVKAAGVDCDLAA